jgi:flagellar basal body rod protein FlgG
MYNQYTYQALGIVNRHMKVLGDKVTDVSNIFTTGYQAKINTFHDTLNGLRVTERKDFTPGVPGKTNGELDFAIGGKGFFEVELPDGTRAYTRNGAFKIGADGQLLSAQGYPVITASANPEFISRDYDNISGGGTLSFDAGVGAGAVIIPTAATVIMSDDGTLKTDAGDTIGKLSVVTFTNVDGLHDVGDGLYIPTDQVGEIHEAEIGTMLGQTPVRQGHLEQANVSIVDKMADIVQINTAIKAEMKIIKVLDQMQENLNSTITRNI